MGDFGFWVSGWAQGSKAMKREPGFGEGKSWAWKGFVISWNKGVTFVNSLPFCYEEQAVLSSLPHSHLQQHHPSLPFLRQIQLRKPTLTFLSSFPSS